MKKTISILLIISLLFAFTACGNDEKVKETTTVEEKNNFIKTEISADDCDDYSDELKQFMIEIPIIKGYEEYTFDKNSWEYQADCVHNDGEPYSMVIDCDTDDGKYVCIALSCSDKSFTVDKLVCGRIETRYNENDIEVNEVVHFYSSNDIIASIRYENDVIVEGYTKTGYTVKDGKCFNSQGESISRETFEEEYDRLVDPIMDRYTLC